MYTEYELVVNSMGDTIAIAVAVALCLSLFFIGVVMENSEDKLYGGEGIGDVFGWFSGFSEWYVIFCFCYRIRIWRMRMGRIKEGGGGEGEKEERRRRRRP